MSKNKGRAVIT